MQKFNFEEFIVNPKNKIAKRIIFKNEHVIAFVLNIAQGAALPGHTHEDSALLVQILRGNADFIIDDNTVIPLKTGEIIEVDGREKMQVDNTGMNTLSIFVTISPNIGDQYGQNADL